MTPSIVFNGLMEETLDLEKWMTEEDVFQSCLELLNGKTEGDIEEFKECCYIEELNYLPKFLSKEPSWDDLEEILQWSTVVLEIQEEYNDVYVEAFLLFQEHEGLEDPSDIKEQFIERFRGSYYYVEDYLYEWFQDCSDLVKVLSDNNLERFFDWKRLAEEWDGHDFYSIEWDKGYFIFDNY